MLRDSTQTPDSLFASASKSVSDSLSNARMTTGPALQLMYSAIEQANQLLLDKKFEKAQKRFAEIVTAFEKTAYLKPFTSFNVHNIQKIPREGDGGKAMVKVRPEYVYFYAKSMANMLDRLSPTEELSQLIVKLWDAGTQMENVDKTTKKDIFKNANSNRKRLQSEINSLAKKIESDANGTTAKNTYERPGVKTDDGLNGDSLKDFKGQFKYEGDKSLSNFANPLYVAEDRYLRMLEWLDDKPRDPVQLKFDTLSSTPKKVNP